jgi:hypothetical protein
VNDFLLLLFPAFFVSTTPQPQQNNTKAIFCKAILFSYLEAPIASEKKVIVGISVSCKFHSIVVAPNPPGGRLKQDLCH